MLSDPAFRRTSRCTHYEAYLESKNASVPLLPVTRVESNGKTPGTLNKELRTSSSSFQDPFVVTGGNIAALGIKVPDSSYTLQEVSRVIGDQTPVKIIEVGEQNEVVGTLGSYADYLAGRTSAHKTLNMITLEFSGTPFNSKGRRMSS
jgi:hypothetical protein